MRWHEIKDAIRADLLARELKKPGIRLGALDSVEQLLIRRFSNIVTNPKVLLVAGKETVARDLARLKGSSLNAAEKSVLNDIFAGLKQASTSPSKSKEGLFTVGNQYSKQDIYSLLGVPENLQGGNWDTGYHSYNEDSFIFANVGVAGRTGHDYRNRWVRNDDGSEDLEWEGKGGKNPSRLDHPATQRLLHPIGRTLVFWRAHDREPFTFAGCAVPRSVADTEPVSVRWMFPDGSGQLVEEAVLSRLEGVQSKSNSSRKGGQGIQISAEERKAIEDHAMALARDHFESNGWKVEDVCRYRSYDLHCTQKDRVLHVEVKGTKTAGESVLLSRNEVLLALDPDTASALYIVRNIETVHHEGRWEASGSDVYLIHPWSPVETDLEPVGYRYSVPGG